MSSSSKQKKRPTLLESVGFHSLNEAAELMKSFSTSAHPLKENPLEERTDERTLWRADEPAGEQCDSQTDGLGNGHSDGHTSGHTEEQSGGHSRERTEGHPLYDPFIWITSQQAKVLQFLIKNESRVTKLDHIEKYTGVPYGTVRKAISALVSENCISKPLKIRKGQFQGLSYTVNETVCRHFKPSKYCGGKEEHRDGQTKEHSGGHSQERTLWRTGEQAVTNSSSTVSKTLTTKEEIEQALNHPELSFWEDQFRWQQVATWQQNLGQGLEEIIQSLKYCAFDLNVLQKKITSKPVNYFWGTIKKCGLYPKPNGYRSYEARLLDAQKERIEKKKKLLEELRAAEAEEAALNMEIEFEKIWQNPAGDLHKMLFDQLDDFVKQNDASPILRKKCMRIAYEDYIKKQQMK